MFGRVSKKGVVLAAMVAGLVPVGDVAAVIGDHDWSAGYDTGGETAVDGAGDVVIHGAFFAPIDFGGGTLNPVNFFDGDQYLARYDANGNHLWSVQFSPNGFGVANEIVACDPSGNIYVAGNTFNGTTLDYGGGPLPANEIYVAKFGPDGTFQWSSSYGAGTIKGIAADNTHVVVTGFTTGADFGGGTVGAGGGNDVFVARLTAAGAHVWSAGFGDATDQGGLDVALDGAGNALMVGSMNGTVDFGGSGLVATDLDLFLASFSSAGVHNWSQVFDGTFTAGGGILVEVGVDASTAGAVAIAGEMVGAVDFGGGVLPAFGFADVYVAMFNSSGIHQWSAGHGAAATSDGADDVAFDMAGNVLVTGTFGDDVDFGGGDLIHNGVPANGDYNMFVAQYDGAGGHLFSAGYGQQVYATGCGIGGGVVVINGLAGSAIDLGGGPLSSYQLFLGRIDGGGGGISAVDDLPGFGSVLTGFPNPFNPRTTITYTLDRDAMASVTVYDLRGRLVDELVAPGPRTAGTHRVSFTPRASGIYLVKLRAGGVERTLKMTAVK